MNMQLLEKIFTESRETMNYRDLNCERISATVLHRSRMRFLKKKSGMLWQKWENFLQRMN